MSSMSLVPSLSSACGARSSLNASRYGGGIIATPSFSSQASPCTTRYASSRTVVRCGPSGARNFPRGPAGSPQTASGLYLPFLKPAETISDNAGGSDGTQLTTADQLALLAERTGFWHEQAPLLESLKRAGVSPAVIMEATGMTGVEQNALTVAAQVRGDGEMVTMG